MLQCCPCPPPLYHCPALTLFIQQKLQAVKYCHAQRSEIRIGIGFAIGIGTCQHCMTAGKGAQGREEVGSCQRGAQGEIIRSFVASINTILMSAAWRFCWRSLRAPQFSSSATAASSPSALCPCQLLQTVACCLPLNL